MKFLHIVVLVPFFASCASQPETCYTLEFTDQFGRAFDISDIDICDTSWPITVKECVRQVMDREEHRSFGRYRTTENSPASYEKMCETAIQKGTKSKISKT